VFKDDELSVISTCLAQLDFMADFRHRLQQCWFVLL